MPSDLPTVQPPVPSLMARKTARSTGKVTLSHVAQAAGVSAMTASRALRGAAGVKSASAARVQEAAHALGYAPDPAARALASRRSDHVAVLVPMLSNSLFVDVLQAIQNTLHPRGFQTLIGITHYDPAQEEQLLREQLLHRPAGILMTGFEQTAAARQMMAISAIPCVHMMALADQSDVHCVGFSQVQAARVMTQHLIDRGHRRIAFVAAQMDARTVQRLQGWRSAMHSNQLFAPELEMTRPEPSSMQLGFDWFAQILAAPQPQPDAVFFCNDDLAQGALLCAQKMGVSVPQRMAVAGFNDLVGSALMLPPLTTVRTPRHAIGAQAAQMLLQLMQGLPCAHTQVDLGFELMVRQST